MYARFFAPDARTSGGQIALPSDEARHLSRVLRLGVGAAIRVFDGAGREFDAVVESVTKGEARVRLGDPVAATPELPVALTLAMAVLKGDKMDDVVRDATMMGVSAIQPLLTSRTEVAAATLERGHRVERWQRIAVASVKQCGRAVVPAVREPQSVSACLAGHSATHTAVMLVEPGVAANAMPLSGLGDAAPAAATLLIGPEGGWTPQEVAAAAGACQLLTLGGMTLRADAAPMVATTALLARWRLL